MAAIPRTIRFLTATQIIFLHQIKIANTVPTQPELLESAVSSPMNVKHYAGQDNIFQLAASLSEKIMRNHAFQDGNKRTALIAADMFLKINGYNLQKVPMADDQANKSIADAHVALVTNRWTPEELGRFYERVATPVDVVTEEIMAFQEGAMEY